MPWPKWPDEGIEILYEYWGAFRAAEVTARVNKACGTNYTIHAARGQARALGLDAFSAQGWVTIAEAARQVGLSQPAASKAVKRHNIESVKRRLYSFITVEGLEKLKAIYPPIKERVVTPPEAAKLIGIKPSWMSKLIKQGEVRSIQRGGFHFVPMAEVERLRLDRLKAKHKRRTCPFCGEPNKRPDPKAVYCSDRCIDDQANAIRRERRRIRKEQAA